MDKTKINKDRKLSSPDKRRLLEIMRESNHAAKQLDDAQTETAKSKAQQEWESFIGADKVRVKIREYCSTINELNTQLVEQGCEPVHADDRIHSAWVISRDKPELKLEGSQLEKYKEHQARMRSIDEARGQGVNDYYEVSAILHIETVGDALEVLGKTAPQLVARDEIGVSRILETKEVEA